MKKILIILLALLSFNVTTVIAEESILCSLHYKNVVRKVENIKGYGTNLSKIARDTLLDDLKYDTRRCISECEGKEFKYCNDVAKWIAKD